MLDMQRQGLTASRLANLGANAIDRGSHRALEQFRSLTERSPGRFKSRDWRGGQRDALQRLDVHREQVQRTKAEIEELLGDLSRDKFIWAGIKAVYSGFASARNDWELAETFFNSVTRRVFATVGADPLVEFVTTDFPTPPSRSKRPATVNFNRAGSTVAVIESVLADIGRDFAFSDLRVDARAVAARIDERLGTDGYDSLDLVPNVFYRGKGAYIVGRLVSGDQPASSFVLALRNGDQGVFVDAVLLDSDDISVLFSFTRSHFQIAVDRPWDLVAFLQELMPNKPRSELYTALGFHKHGKTELYRHLLAHVDESDDKFEIAEGARGLVMAVFALPEFGFVFKVLRDRFGPPKETTHEHVKDRYRVVFKHDRAGRLIDAQEFEHLQFSRRHFDEEVLAELEAECRKNVHIYEEVVVIKHCYVERMVHPLNLRVRGDDPAIVEAAVLDYGQAIKDLAYTNIFPGDLLTKNFGATRLGRVVFYDYDELAKLTDCSFKPLPVSTHADDEMAAEPWFGVASTDIFPEEFRRFLGLPTRLRAVLEEAHGDLFAPEFWIDVQRRINGGEIIDITPYPPSRRLHDEAK